MKRSTRTTATIPVVVALTVAAFGASITSEDEARPLLASTTCEVTGVAAREATVVCSRAVRVKAVRRLYPDTACHQAHSAERWNFAVLSD